MARVLPMPFEWRLAAFYNGRFVTACHVLSGPQAQYH